MSATEKVRREKWIEEKTKKIKEITVKGTGRLPQQQLEPGQRQGAPGEIGTSALAWAVFAPCFWWSRCQRTRKPLCAHAPLPAPFSQLRALGWDPGRAIPVLPAVPGLEPEIQKLLAKHREDIRQLKLLHEAELLQSDERAAQHYGRQAQELRGLLEREKEEQSQRERERARQRCVTTGSVPAGGSQLGVLVGSQCLQLHGEQPLFSPPASGGRCCRAGNILWRSEGQGGEEASAQSTALECLCPTGVSSSWSRRSRRWSCSGAGSMPRWPRRRRG